MSRKVLAACLALFLGFTNGVGPAQCQTLKRVVLKWTGNPGEVHRVFATGSFNDWNGSKDRLTDPDADGVWEAVLLLPRGRYLYKIVLDDQWIPDPAVSESEPDGRQGRNSILMVDDRFPDARFERGDGSISTVDIPIQIDYSMVNSLGVGEIEFRAKAWKGDVEKVVLWIRETDGKNVKTTMKPLETDSRFTIYSAVARPAHPDSFCFTFVYKDGSAIGYSTPSGFQSSKPGPADMHVFRAADHSPFHVPQWAVDGVLYQIFLDRFHNGDPSNDQDFHEVYYRDQARLDPQGKTNGEYFHTVSQWNDLAGLVRSPYRTDGRPDYYSFYGGDIAGVSEKLPYLLDLGVNIIYFNPVAEAKSNHKYDTIDYNRVDPHFAGEKEFREFVRKAHQSGIRIIVDMAFNHTGDWHTAFVDTREKGEKSPYWLWYEWNKWPLPVTGAPTPCDYYACWWDFPLHPNLNFDLSRANPDENAIVDIKDAKPNREVVDHILGVVQYWLGTLDIDGFRLDVPNEVPFWFWKLFREEVDRVKPDAYLVGEIWGNAMPWLGPSAFHATMNYRYFRDPVISFLARQDMDASAFEESLASGRVEYPFQAVTGMMNLIGSHDTERFLRTAGGDIRRLKLAALVQMTSPGIPHIYYGDEVALDGGGDPDNRRTFPWEWETDSTRNAVREFYKQVIALRKSHPSLRTGKVRTIRTEGPVLVFSRESKDDHVLVLVNNGPSARRVNLDLKSIGWKEKSLQDTLSGRKSKAEGRNLVIDLEAYAGAVFVQDSRGSDRSDVK